MWEKVWGRSESTLVQIIIFLDTDNFWNNIYEITKKRWYKRGLSFNYLLLYNIELPVYIKYLGVNT